MIVGEHDGRPASLEFDFAIVAIGFEQRCRWVFESSKVQAKKGIGLEFGFLKEEAYAENVQFFGAKGFVFIDGIQDRDGQLRKMLISHPGDSISVIVDISSMSRLMIANVVQAIGLVATNKTVTLSVAYAPSRFSEHGSAGPIRVASPIKPDLAGWSGQPEQPLGVILGLGADPGLALGALQVLEPDKAWAFSPLGVDRRFDRAVAQANDHINDIFDITSFSYEIRRPALTRVKFEALLNAIDSYYRIVAVPFGPKIFSWLLASTLVFTGRDHIGLWAFSSREEARVVNRHAHGTIIWYNAEVRSDRQISALTLA